MDGENHKYEYVIIRNNHVRFAKTACFVAGTKVWMHDYSQKNIEDVLPEDTVRAFDTATRQEVLGKVTHTMIKETSILIEVYTALDTFRVTPEHPFYVNGKWIQAGRLKKGYKLTLLNHRSLLAVKTRHLPRSAEVLIDSIATKDTLVRVYNFTVEKFHNYYVGNVGSLVHNRNICVTYSNEVFEAKLTTGSKELLAKGVMNDNKSTLFILPVPTASVLEKEENIYQKMVEKFESEGGRLQEIRVKFSGQRNKFIQKFEETKESKKGYSSGTVVLNNTVIGDLARKHKFDLTYILHSENQLLLSFGKRRHLAEEKKAFKKITTKKIRNLVRSKKFLFYEFIDYEGIESGKTVQRINNKLIELVKKYKVRLDGVKVMSEEEVWHKLGVSPFDAPFECRDFDIFEGIELQKLLLINERDLNNRNGYIGNISMYARPSELNEFGKITIQTAYTSLEDVVIHEYGHILTTPSTSRGAKVNFKLSVLERFYEIGDPKIGEWKYLYDSRQKHQNNISEYANSRGSNPKDPTSKDYKGGGHEMLAEIFVRYHKKMFVAKEWADAFNYWAKKTTGKKKTIKEIADPKKE